MFITNRMSPGEVLANLFDLRGCTETDTAEFAKYKHNEHLCACFRRNVDAILAAYDGYRANVHDIQSFTDEGADILLTYEDMDGLRRRAALQIKSYSEFEASKGVKATPMTTTLLLQHSRAAHNVHVDEYYIVLCTDAAKHRTQIRGIASAFKNYADVRIVIPQKALAFFKLGTEEVTLRVTQILCEDDLVLKAARKEVADDGELPLKFMIELTCRALSGYTSISVEELLSIGDRGDDDDGEGRELIDLVNQQEFGGMLERLGDDEFAILIDRLPIALCALYFDQKVRHHPGDIVAHLFGLLFDEHEPESDDNTS